MNPHAIPASDNRTHVALLIRHWPERLLEDIAAGHIDVVRLAAEELQRIDAQRAQQQQPKDAA